MKWDPQIGAQPEVSSTRFCVWAPNARRVDVVLYEGAGELQSQALAPEQDGYFAGIVGGVRPGARYMYRLDGGTPRPDPAARSQPDGVHGPSQVVDPTVFAWSDGDWHGLPLEDLVIYELHVGTATRAGTFDALIEHLDQVAEFGVTAIELMPVADFPGDRNWGYDGVSLFAPSRAYGGPEGLRRLVDAAHARGLAVMLDVVYNHFGPDGNYLREFSGSYFTDRHKTPWGDALNFDGPGSRPVRDFFIANALHWAHEYHLDGLRLDATHAIIDDSTPHILAEIAARVHASLPPDRAFVLIAENEHNDPTLLRSQKSEVSSQKVEASYRKASPVAAAPLTPIPHPLSPDSQPLGYGLDAVWVDDFHHQVRVAVAHDSDGYYRDYTGDIEDIVATLQQGWFYTGQWSVHLGRHRGGSPEHIPPWRLIYCLQNHDQVGNRAFGDRLNHTIEPEVYRAISALLLLSPYTPALWMGQEWAASTPFLYFTDHNPELGRLVTQGRRAEFAGFSSFDSDQVPDPQDPATFERSKLRWDEREGPPHDGVLRLYRDLIHLRRTLPALRNRARGSFTVRPIGEHALALLRREAAGPGAILTIVNLESALSRWLGDYPELAPPAGANWAPLLDSEDPRYGGSGGMRISQDLMITLQRPGSVVLNISPNRGS